MTRSNCIDLQDYKRRLLDTKYNELIDITAFTADYLDIARAMTSANSAEDELVLKLDTMTMWFTRGLQLSKRNTDVILLFCSPEMSAKLLQVFNYLCQVYETGNGPSTNAASSLLTKFLQFTNKVCTLSKNADLPTQISLSFLSIPHTQKSFFIIADSFLREIDDAASILMTPDNTFSESCLEAIQSSALANSSSKAFASLYVQLHNPRTSSQEYIQAWSPLIVRSLKCHTRRSNIINHLIPKLFKPCPGQFKDWIKSLNIEKSSKDWRIIILPLLNSMFLFSSKGDASMEDLLSSEELISLLNHRDEKCRRDAYSWACSVVCASKLSSGDYLDAIFDDGVLNTFFKESITPESRTDFFSTLRKVLIYCRDLIIKEDKCSKEKLRSARETVSINLKLKLQAFYKFICLQFIPDSSYSQLALGTEFLRFFIEYEFDGVDRRLKKDLKSRHFIFEIFTSDLTGTLMRFLTNNYDDVRQQCSEMLIHCPVLTFNQIYEEKLTKNSLCMLSSLKGRQSDAASKILRIIAHIQIKNGNLEKFTDSFCLLLSSMNGQVELDLPIHGYFTAAGAMLATIPPVLFEKVSSRLNPMIASLLHTMLHIWQISKPQLINTFSESEEESESRAWRSVKESSYLINIILKLNVANSWKLLEQNVFLSICELLMEQLSVLSHRGAFSAIYPTFLEACKICYQANLDNKPQQWLRENLRLLETKEQLITRRSAGLPFLLIAILNSSTSDTNRFHQFIDMTFSELFRIAQKAHTPCGNEINDLAQVHAFNCMRYIFRDKNLSIAISGYLQKALEISLSNLDHSTWAIKNGAIMLFTTLQERLFGLYKLSDSNPGRSASLFWSKYSGIKELLLENLYSPKKSNDAFLVLSMLSRLQAFSDDDTSLDIFVDTVIQNFIGHEAWKIREMAARVICTMTNSKKVLPVAERLNSCSELSRNEIHGRLMCILEFVKSKNTPQSDIQLFIESVQIWALKTGRTAGWVNLRAALLVLASNKLATESYEFIKSLVLTNLDKKLKPLNGSERLFVKSAVAIVMEACMDNEELALLTKSCFDSESYEAQLAAIHFWQNQEDALLDRQDVQTLFWNLVDNDATCNQVKAGAMEVLVNIGVSRQIPITPSAAWNCHVVSLNIVLDARSAKASASQILETIKTMSVDSLPENRRLLTVMALKSLIPKVQKKNVIATDLWLHLYDRLNDDSQLVRSSACVDDLGVEASKVFALGRLKENASAHFADAILDRLTSEITRDLRTLEREKQNNLFEIERDNLFCNEVSSFCQLLELVRDLSISNCELKDRLQGAACRSISEVWKSMKSNEKLISSWTYNVHLDSAIRKTLNFETVCTEKDRTIVEDIRCFLSENNYHV